MVSHGDKSTFYSNLLSFKIYFYPFFLCFYLPIFLKSYLLKILGHVCRIWREKESAHKYVSFDIPTYLSIVYNTTYSFPNQNKLNCHKLFY